MKKILLYGLFLLAVAVPVQSANPQTFSWTAPTLHVDGTPLASSAIAGYTVYCGTATGVYTITKAAGNVTAYPVSSVLTGNGTYYCAVTTVKTNGVESDKSNEISFLFDIRKPVAPALFNVQ